MGVKINTACHHTINYGIANALIVLDEPFWDDFLTSVNSKWMQRRLASGDRSTEQSCMHISGCTTDWLIEEPLLLSMRNYSESAGLEHMVLRQ